MAVQIQLRRDTAANWTATNPVLVQGEPGLETDTSKIKIGDGTTAWTSLAYQAAANIVDGTIVNADINASAAIVDTKLATIATAGKVSNSATTATSANTNSAIVARDGSGNFSAGTITAALTGAASSNVLKAGDTMTGALVHPLGAAATPSITFTGDLNTGIYSPGADQVGVATNGAQRLTVDTAATTSTLPIVHPLGAVGTPSITFTGDLNTGLWSPTADTLAASTNGSERLRITSAGLVGIGTSSPADLLHINGGMIRIQRDTPQILFRSADGSSNQYYIGANISSTVNGGFVIGEGPGITGGTPRIAINSSGKVGIGTTNPGDTLSVVGTARVLNTATDTAAIAFDFNGGVPRIRSTVTGTATVQPLTFATGTTEHCRIDTSGRLLVGTSSASTTLGALTAKLQVQGTSVFDTGITNALWESSTNPAQLQLVKSRGASIGTQAVVQNNDNLGRILFGGSDGTDFESAAWIQCEVDGTPGANDMPGRLVFSTTADGASSPTERLRITSAGVLQVADAGNITVGTTTGTKIGTATTQKLGFYNATPVVQPAAVANATDAASVITQLNDLLAKLRTLGIIAT